MYGAGDFYADKALMSPENLMMAAEYGQYQYDNLVSGHRIPGFESEELGYQCSAVSESASINVGGEADHGEELASGVIKARIASHPSYPKLLDAYIDCQKVCVQLIVAILILILIFWRILVGILIRFSLSL